MRPTAILATALVVGGCGTAATTAPASVPPPDGSPSVEAMSPTSDPPVSNTTPHPTISREELWLAKVPETVGLAECLVTLHERLDGDLAFTADSVTVGERHVIERPDIGALGVYRDLEFSGVQPIIAPPGFDVDADAVLATSEAVIIGGVISPSSVIDFAQVDGLTDVLALGSAHSASGGPIVSLVIAENDGEVTAAGSCTGLLQHVAGGLASEMGFGGSVGTIDFVTEWVAAGPAERAEYAAAEVAWLEAQDRPVEWVDQDPRVRAVRPEMVPDELRAELEVRAAVVDLEGESSEYFAVAFVSDDGIGLSVGLASDRGALPFYYFPETAGEIRLLLTEIAEPETPAAEAPIAVISVDDLTTAGGVLVDGTMLEPRVRILSWEAVAEEMGVGRADLDRLRTELLTP